MKEILIGKYFKFKDSEAALLRDLSKSLGMSQTKVIIEALNLYKSTIESVK